MASDADIIAECRQRKRDCEESTSEIRTLALEDMKFSMGEQWPPELMTQRQLEERPCMVINWTDSLVRQVTNNMRQQRPRIKVHPVNNGADEKMADVLQGLTRHIEVNSYADAAYDTAGDHAVRIGFGYWRIVPKYVREDSFDQDLHIEPVKNPFSVYLDDLRGLPDGSSAEWAVVMDRMSKVHFHAKHPDYEPVSLQGMEGVGTGEQQWIDRDTVMLAEYYKLDLEKDRLVMLSDGVTRWKSELGEQQLEVFAAQGIHVVGDRESYRKKLLWWKLGGDGILDHRESKARFIPIIPVYGYEMDVGGLLTRKGMVRDLRDPQMSYNWFRTNSTEVVAGQPRNPWLLAAGQSEGFQDEWQAANRKNLPYLQYTPVTDPSGQLLPPPTRLPPPQLSQGYVEMTQEAAGDMRLVAGIFDATMGNQGDERSGRAIAERQRQSEVSNYAFYDNLTRSIRHTGRVLLDLIPIYYDTRRVVRIVGVDGKPDMVTLNDKQRDQMGAIIKVLNDTSVGTYDVVMDTGPGYDTKREEAAEQMTDLLRVLPQAAQVGGDILVRNLDWPGADQLADRLEAANPLANMDENLSDDPDKLKAMVMHLQAQAQEMQKQLVALGMDKKYRLSAIAMQQHGEDGRHSLTEQTTMQREALEDETWRHDIQQREAGKLAAAHIQGKTDRDVATIKAAVDLIGKHLGAHIDWERLEQDERLAKTAERKVA